jgi:hypothetical protein
MQMKKRRRRPHPEVSPCPRLSFAVQVSRRIKNDTSTQGRLGDIQSQHAAILYDTCV